jgi:hypothetical protein
MPSLTQFRDSFVTDIARPKLFDVIMPPPNGLINYRDTARNLTFRCESTQFPSRTFATTEQKFGTNPTEKHAYHTTYNDIEMTFIVSEDMSERKFFDAWLNLINPTSSFDFNYRDDYITDFYVYQYDGAISKTTYSIALIDAFPISVNQLDLDWSNDSYHKLSVTFAYRYWQIIDPEELAKQAFLKDNGSFDANSQTKFFNNTNSRDGALAYPNNVQSTVPSDQTANRKNFLETYGNTVDTLSNGVGP